MVQHRGDPAHPQQPDVVRVQVVRDQHRGRAVAPDLVALAFQVGDGRAHLPGGAVADTGAAVEYPVDRGLAEVYF
jgi:hypothetical protein